MNYNFGVELADGLYAFEGGAKRVEVHLAVSGQRFDEQDECLLGLCNPASLHRAASIQKKNVLAPGALEVADHVPRAIIGHLGLLGVLHVQIVEVRDEGHQGAGADIIVAQGNARLVDVVVSE